MFRSWIVFAWMLLLPFLAKATHVIGGEITYRCLGNQQYEINLTVYRDCFNGQPWFDNPAWVSVFRADWTLADTLMLPYVSNDTLPIILSNPCLTAPPNICVHKSAYRDTVTLPFVPGGYTIVYQRCCRNQLIQNIWYPLDSGASFIAEIGEAALLECNSSAEFRSWPPIAICVHEPIDFDHGATDVDGDSLVYRLCTPLLGADTMITQPKPPKPGPYAAINWVNPPYSDANMLGGPNPLTIDPHSGFLTGVPNTIGNFVVGICVDEYRDGALISSTRRDFQYNVAACGYPNAAFFAPAIICDGLTVSFDNQSANASQFTWYFDVLGDTTAVSQAKNPQYTYPDTGTYTVMLIATTNTICRDTFFRTITLKKSFISAEYDLTFPDCTDGILTIAVHNLTVDTAFGIASFAWVLDGPPGVPLQLSSDPQPVFYTSKPGYYTLGLTVSSNNGCVLTLNDFFLAPIPEFNTSNDTLRICLGDSVQLNPNGNPNFHYTWEPAQFLNSDTIANPWAKPTIPVLFTVEVQSAESPCTQTFTRFVQVEEPAPLQVSANPLEIQYGQSTELMAFMENATGYVWVDSLNMQYFYDKTFSAFPEKKTTYYVTATDIYGCSRTDSVAVTVRIPDCDAPYVFLPTAFSPNGDGQNETLRIEGITVDSVHLTIFDRWGEIVFETFSQHEEWDGTFKGVPMPAEVYAYQLEVTCRPTGKLAKQGNITLLR